MENSYMTHHELDSHLYGTSGSGEL